jgi:hypothetical protein
MQHLWRQALWGSAAAVALLVAILTGFSDSGSQRAASILSSFRSGQTGSQAARHAFDAEAAARQLAQSVRGLAEDRDRMMTRLTAVERNIDDMTGSITRQIEAAKAAAQAPPAPWPGEATSAPTLQTNVESVAAPIVPPLAGLESPLRAVSAAPAGEQSAPDATGSVTPPAYGADIGGAPSMKALRTRWAGIHSAHAQIFEGLQPVVTVKDNARSNRLELRLVVGPLANAEQAAELCASLAVFRLSCQPTMFDDRHLALQ